MEWTPRTAEELAGSLMSGMGDRWRHVQGVAERLGELTGDPSCLMAAWLHDIGYAEPLVVTGMHAIDGATYLARAGAPGEVVALVAFHTGAEFEAVERDLADRLGEFCQPDPTALELLTLADLTTDPTGKPVSVAERLDEILSRYDAQHPVHSSVSTSRAELEERCRRALQSA